MTSIPGAAEVTVECLEGSALPEELRGLGHRPEMIGHGERILPAAIREAVLTEGSTKPLFMLHHAGIARVERYSFTLPSAEMGFQKTISLTRRPSTGPSK